MEGRKYGMRTQERRGNREKKKSEKKCEDWEKWKKGSKNEGMVREGGREVKRRKNTRNDGSLEEMIECGDRKEWKLV